MSEPRASSEPEASDQLFVEFANTLEQRLDEPRDAIRDVPALLDWLAGHELIGERTRSQETARLRRDPDGAERRLERFRHLRQLVHAMSRRANESARPTRDQLRDLNHILRHGLHYHQLRPAADGSRYTVSQIGDPFDQARATIASSLAHFLAGGERDRLRTCANETCGWVFVDRSPTGRRRWCDMRTCGNQAKVARHRARARTRAASAGASV